MTKGRKDARPAIGVARRAAESETNNHESPDTTIVAQGGGFVKSSTRMKAFFPWKAEGGELG